VTERPLVRAIGMAHTSVPEPATGWADAVRNSRLAAPGAGVDPAAVGTIATLFRDHHGELGRLGVVVGGGLPTAEDVVQDVYTSLHQRWSQVAAADSPLPYVRAAVLNGCRSVLRRRGIARRAGVLHRASQPDDALASAESEVGARPQPQVGVLVVELGQPAPG